MRVLRAKNPSLKKASDETEASSKEYELCKSSKSTVEREEIKGREAGVAWFKARCQGIESKVLEELGLSEAMRRGLPNGGASYSANFLLLKTSRLSVYPQIHGGCSWKQCF